MSIKIHVPLSELLLEDKQGNVHKMVRFRIRDPGTDKVSVGEIPTSAILTDGPTGWSTSNFYIDAPYSTTVGSADNRRVGVKNRMRNPDGEYKLLVSFKGRNVAGL